MGLGKEIEKTVINSLLERIEFLLNSKPSKEDSEKFFELECFVVENYGKFSDNPDVISIAEDEIVDICSWISTGQDCTTERNTLNKIYHKLKKIA